MCVKPQFRLYKYVWGMTTQFAKSKPHCIAVQGVATLRQICRNTNAKKSMHVCNIYVEKAMYMFGETRRKGYENQPSTKGVCVCNL